MLVVDANFVIKAANKATEKLVGKLNREIIGRRYCEIIYNCDIPPEDCPLKRSLESGKVESTDRYEPAFGLHFSTKISQTFDEKGNVVQFVVLMRDISEHVRMDEEREQLLKELEARNTELEQFTYTVSHDLRSPLITVQGFAEMLREDLEQGKTEDMKSGLERIETAAAKMDHLLTDTLQLSCIGRFVNPPEDVSFGELVQDTLRLTAGELKSSGVG